MKAANCIFLLMILSMGCGPGPQAIAEPVQVDDRPAWVKARPQSNHEYIGIGRAVKGMTSDYEQVARKNGLEDLAGEIQVKVNSNSLLYTLEHDERFSESYTQSIQTSTDLVLEGFEIADSYQDKDYYWVYYRLDKGEYAKTLAQRKQEALHRSAGQLTLARSSSADADVAAAAGHYVGALQELQAYWGENNDFKVAATDGSGASTIALDRTALDELYQMRSEFHLSDFPDIIRLEVENGFTSEVVLHALLGSKTLANMPFVYNIEKGNIETKVGRELRVQVRPGESQQRSMNITVDPFESLRKQVRGGSMGFVAQLLSPLTASITLQTIYPAVTVQATYTAMDGTTSDSPQLRSAVVRELAKQGIGADDSSASPYRILIEAQARNGGVAQGFQVVYTDMTITAGNTQTNITAYSTDVPSAKGVHKTMESASQVSIDKCSEKINRSIMEPLIEALF